MEPAPVLDALEDEEVRRARGELDVGGADHRPAVEVRRDLGAVRLGERGDLLALQDPAAATEVRLDDRRCAERQQLLELVLRGEPLARGDGDRGLAGDLGHLGRLVGRNRLLEPQRVVGLEPLRQADGARRGELPVRAEEEVGP